MKKTAGSKKFTFIGFAPLLLLAAVLYAMYTGSVKGFIEVQNRQIRELPGKESVMAVFTHPLSSAQRKTITQHLFSGMSEKFGILFLPKA